ncbi:hypothetical protein WICPIJ_009987 [Wickerhamomyces pijperi]|uniref:Uncharacterized protein n=1 Tax=Wickerhamomyces pijperi TaxID=599730 RepID=A0A9P8PK00_WICPI|nr:hypothetical protein WICPIJ_009987 [Wickerhamomyces pijperi]
MVLNDHLTHRFDQSLDSLKVGFFNVIGYVLDHSVVVERFVELDIEIKRDILFLQSFKSEDTDQSLQFQSVDSDDIQVLLALLQSYNTVDLLTIQFDLNRITSDLSLLGMHKNLSDVTTSFLFIQHDITDTFRDTL